MIIREHSPGIIEGYKKTAHFADLATLLALPWVDQWAHRPGFYRFSFSDGTLMAEFDGGQAWEMVGHLSLAPESIGLPLWELKRKGKEAVR